MQTPVVATFSSRVLLNGEGDPISRFTTFTLGGTLTESLETMVNAPGEEQPTQLGFRGRGLAAKHTQVAAIACKKLVNGAPRANLAEDCEAVAMRGELVNLSLTTPDGTTRMAGGVITFTPAYGPTGIVQRFDIVFHTMALFGPGGVVTQRARLLFANTSTYLDAAPLP